MVERNMNDKKPHFLEVFLPNLSSERLEVPFKFNKHLLGITSGALSLIGPSGNTWLVDLIDNDGHLFFDDGWPTFMKDHSVQCGDCLVFRYDGNLQFTVQIFDQTSCEKEEAFNATCSQESINCNGNLWKKRGRDKDVYFLDLVGEKKRKGTLIPAQLDMPTSKEEKSLPSTSRKASVVKPDTKAFTEMNAAAAKKQNEAIDISISKFIESRAEEYITSGIPYFVKVMNYHDINTCGSMRVPRKFSAAYLPNYKAEVTLRNLNGDCWMVNCVITSTKSHTQSVLSRGWLSFVRENDIKVEDVCIFELVGELEMAVRVLRLGVEAPEDQTENIIFDEICGRHSESAADRTQYTSGDQLLDDLEQLTDFNIYYNGNHKVDIEIIPASKPEVKVEMLQKSPSRSCQSPLSRTCNVYSDMNLRCDADEPMSDETSRNTEVVDLNEIIDNPALVEEATDYTTFTSSFPNFMKIMDSGVGRSFTLNVPRLFSAAHFPFHESDIELQNMEGNSWVVNATRYGNQTKLCGGWMAFVLDNGVKIGDVCIFELVKEKVLQVRVFKGGHKSQERQLGNVADDSTICTNLPHVEAYMSFRPG